MKQSVSFSGDNIEKTSLNFEKLRDLGIEYVQELASDDWTDFNAHDPGVTILEQLCYALTDVAFRSSFSVEDLLSPRNGKLVDAKDNAFYSPSAIFSSHPVTSFDLRKIIIDNFEQIQNVWIHQTKRTDADKMNGINDIEILPKLNFLKTLNANSNLEKEFLTDLNTFLDKNRNIGECFNAPQLLKPQTVEIVFDLHIDEYINLDETISNVFLALFEYVYRPVHHYSFNELLDDKNSIEEIFNGPVLSNGFIKNEIAEKKLEILSVNELQKLISKVSGVEKCVVSNIGCKGEKYDQLRVKSGNFFHLLVNSQSDDDRFEYLFKNMNVLIKHQKTPFIRKQNISNMFLESWAKKHRGYSISDSHEDFFQQKLKGKYRNPGEYHSIQNHFPGIYGIGKNGLSKNDTDERHAKANQLKAYLLLFEQHMANHLAQLENLNSFFNIDSDVANGKTYFTQTLSSVPGIDKLLDDDADIYETLT
jgi:hypothetical protein